MTTLSPEIENHQQLLLNYLTQRYMAQKEQLSFADFMQIALYAPGLGYYSAGAHKFGRSGDFVTAPEISLLFSQCVAHQCQEILALLEPANSCILELGAGSGKMAKEIITFLEKEDCLPQCYYILEISADLKQRQQLFLQQHCPEFYPCIKWLSHIPTEAFSGIILGNEVLDAMPVHLFQVNNEGDILEGVIQKIENQWQYRFAPPLTPKLIPAVRGLEQLLNTSFSHPYTSEINLQLTPWLASINACLKSGVMLFIDYGFPAREYYHPSRSMGTLMCHYRHQSHSDFLAHIGLQDITAHVDFTALALAAIHCQLDVAGYAHQAGFLLANDILTFAEKAAAHELMDQITLSKQIQVLTHPHEMGELVKAIAFTKDFAHPLRGFQFHDQRYRL